jgi:transposase
METDTFGSAAEEETDHGVLRRFGRVSGEDAICVLDRDGTVVHEAIAHSSAKAISMALAEAPACTRLVFETGRMAPMLSHGLTDLAVPVVCIESRQAYQDARDAQDRSQRRPRAGETGEDRLLQACAWKSLSAHAVRALIIARKKLVGQRVTLENQIRGLAVVFGVRLPRGLSPAFVDQVTGMSEGVVGLAGAMRGLLVARDAVLGAISAIDADMRKLVRASDACRQLMTIPGVGQLTALAFTAAIDDPDRFRRSRDLGAYLGLVPRRYQSGEIDYVGGISKVGDRRVRSLLYEAANVMLTRYKGELKLKTWALAIARRSTMRKARVALARRLAIIMHAMLRHGTTFQPA